MRDRTFGVSAIGLLVVLVAAGASAGQQPVRVNASEAVAPSDSAPANVTNHWPTPSDCAGRHHARRPGARHNAGDTAHGGAQGGWTAGRGGVHHYSRGERLHPARAARRRARHRANGHMGVLRRQEPLRLGALLGQPPRARCRDRAATRCDQHRQNENSPSSSTRSTTSRNGVYFRPIRWARCATRRSPTKAAERRAGTRSGTSRPAASTGGWTVEMVIPFKSLRYRDRPADLGLQLPAHRQLEERDVATSRACPRPYGTAGVQPSCRSAATLVGLETPRKSMNLELKPYVRVAPDDRPCRGRAVHNNRVDRMSASTSSTG